MRTAVASADARDLWQFDSLLPAQIDSRKLSMDVPELQLVAAILEDAIHSVARHANSRDRRQLRAYADARDWLLDDARDHCFAFHNVCELLALDSAAVRTWVLTLLDRPHGPAAISAPSRGHCGPPAARHTRQTPRRHGPARPARGGTVRQAPRREYSPQERFERLGWDEV